MMHKTIWLTHFSPTGTSKKTAGAVALELQRLWKAPLTTHDLTLPKGREKGLCLTGADLFVLGFPVYSGRIPGVLADYLKNCHGDGTPLVLIGVYGNRDYDDALLEAADCLSERGFVPIAAGAFIGEHTYSTLVGTGRPDESDLQKARDFAKRIALKLQANEPYSPLSIKGNHPYRALAPSREIVPKTKDSCTKCGRCVHACPMGVIREEDEAMVDKGCINCCACVKICPVNAKHFDDARLAAVKTMLEDRFRMRREPEWFL